VIVLADKKSPGRFTLNFNVEDPKQLAVVNILNRQGRTKAQFITDAILHYMNCTEKPTIDFPPPQMDEDRIKQIVRSLLQEQASPRLQTPPHSTQGEPAQAENTPASVSIAEVVRLMRISWPLSPKPWRRSTKGKEPVSTVTVLITSAGGFLL